MPEMSTRENEQLVSRVYTQIIENSDDNKTLSAEELMVYNIEMLSQEINSGASFVQYFRWASVAEISEAAGRLESLALPGIAKIVRRAIEIAFPDGLPVTDDEKEEVTEWKEEQEEKLSALANEFEAFNGRVIHALAEFYRKREGGV